MILIGKHVTHNKFGQGTIIGLSENKIQVDFTDTARSFIYPESFAKNFSIKDKKAEEYIHARIAEVEKCRKIQQEQKLKEVELKKYISNLKASADSHAVFGMQENKLADILDTWCVFTGNYVTGKHKGEPRIPKKLHMNSACLLTTKTEGSSEAERIIIGMFFPTDHFVGSQCENGKIQAHETYRIIWDCEQEELMFWDYFPNESKLSKWGNCEMKYISNSVIKRILESMLKLTEDRDKQERILEFYHYFCEINNLQDV